MRSASCFRDIVEATHVLIHQFESAEEGRVGPRSVAQLPYARKRLLINLRKVASSRQICPNAHLSGGLGLIRRLLLVLRVIY